MIGLEALAAISRGRKDAGKLGINYDPLRFRCVLEDNVGHHDGEVRLYACRCRADRPGELPAWINPPALFPRQLSFKEVAHRFLKELPELRFLALSLQERARSIGFRRQPQTSDERRVGNEWVRT